jgi:hypothetical protein
MMRGVTEGKAMDGPGHRHHDLGGRPAGSCERDEHEYETWEKRVDALVVLLAYRFDSLTVDELRRHIEDLGPVAYDGLGYYERWMHALTQAMLHRGLITVDELAAKMAEIEARGNG